MNQDEEEIKVDVSLVGRKRNKWMTNIKPEIIENIIGKDK